MSGFILGAVVTLVYLWTGVALSDTYNRRQRHEHAAAMVDLLLWPVGMATYPLSLWLHNRRRRNRCRWRWPGDTKPCGLKMGHPGPHPRRL